MTSESDVYLTSNRRQMSAGLNASLPLRKLAHAIYRDFFQYQKLKISPENVDFFLIFAQNIDCGYTLDVRTASPTIYVLEQNKKNSYTPATPSFVI